MLDVQNMPGLFANLPMPSTGPQPKYQLCPPSSLM
jgi:hypothetical protein